MPPLTQQSEILLYDGRCGLCHNVELSVSKQRSVRNDVDLPVCDGKTFFGPGVSVHFRTSVVVREHKPEPFLL